MNRLTAWAQATTIDKKILAIVLFGAVVVLWKIGAHSYELDEAFSLYISNDFWFMVNSLWREEANMWPYYLILHFWTFLGSSEVWVRSLSAIFSVLTLVIIYKMGSQLISKRVGYIASFLAAMNIFFIFYAQEARGYSLLMFLTTLSTYAFINSFKNKRFRLLYIAASSLAFYAHFYTIFVLLSHLLAAIRLGRWKKEIKNLFVIGGLCLPTLLAPSFQSRQVDWLLSPTVENLVGTAFVLSGDFPPLFLAYGALFLFLILSSWREMRQFKYGFLIATLALPIAASFLVSIVAKPIYQSVYFLISLPSFVILVGVAIEKLPRKMFVQAGVVVMLIVFSALRLHLWYSENDTKWVFANASEDWSAVADHIAENSENDEIVVFFGYYGRLPYSFYSKGRGPQIVEIASGRYNFGGGTALPDPSVEMIGSFENKKIWLVVRNSDTDILNRDGQLAFINSTLLEKYSTEARYEFPEISVISYTKK